MSWSNMVDMELDDEEIQDTVVPYVKDKPVGPKYPWGLRICLTDKELKKLGLEGLPEIGDVIDLRAFACVTSVSANKNEDGSECCRVELQIERLAVESEADEETG